MKKNLLKICNLFLLFAFFFASCEKNVDVDLPKVPEKLVLCCFLTPQDTTITVRLTQSHSVFGNSNSNVLSAIPNATVRLYGNNTSVVIPYDSISGLYKIPETAMAIIPLQTYRIEATAPGFDMISAQTTIPANPPADFNANLGYSVDSATDPYSWNYTITVNYSYTDPVGENFYRIAKNIVSYDNLANDTSLWRFGDDLLTDHDHDGQQITGDDGGQFTFNSPAAGGPQPLGVTVSLLNCSYEYYAFHKSLQNNNGGDDPFSEPSLTYTNISGGFGVFAGATYRNIYLSF